MAFPAKYPGTCADCGLPITPGYLVMYDAHDELVHRQCPGRPDDVSMGDGVPCPSCFCFHAGECAW